MEEPQLALCFMSSGVVGAMGGHTLRLTLFIGHCRNRKTDYLGHIVGPELFSPALPARAPPMPAPLRALAHLPVALPTLSNLS